MATQLTSEEALSQIRSSKKVAILLITHSDELCVRARGSITSCEDRLRGLGFSTFWLEVDPKSNQSEELACVRVPQLRFFSQGKQLHKLVGTIDDSTIDSLFRKL